MDDEKQPPGKIIAVASNGKETRATGIEELFGALVDSVYEKPKTIKEAISLRDDAYKLVASELGLAAKQAKRLHDLLAFYPDESEASGYGERYAILKKHYERFGPLPYQVVYYLLRCALSGSYKKRVRKIASGAAKAKNEPYSAAQEKLINIWKSGQYANRDQCVTAELDDLEKYCGKRVAFRTARRWLNGVAKDE